MVSIRDPDASMVMLPVSRKDVDRADRGRTAGMRSGALLSCPTAAIALSPPGPKPRRYLPGDPISPSHVAGRTRSSPTAPRPGRWRSA